MTRLSTRSGVLSTWSKPLARCHAWFPESVHALRVIFPRKSRGYTQLIHRVIRRSSSDRPHGWSIPVLCGTPLKGYGCSGARCNPATRWGCFSPPYYQARPPAHLGKWVACRSKHRATACVERLQLIHNWPCLSTEKGGLYTFYVKLVAYQSDPDGQRRRPSGPALTSLSAGRPRAQRRWGRVI